jgi:hypothetical protein
MASLPADGRPAPLRLTVRKKEELPRLSASIADLRKAPLSTRTRRQLRRRWTRRVLILTGLTLLAAAAAIWIALPRS